MKRLESSRGFTLIEFMIVVVVIGVISAMAGPSFQRVWERHNFRAGSRAITSKLKAARSFAISTKEPHGVHFDTDRMTVALFQDVVNPGGLAFETGDSTISVDTMPSEFNYLYTCFQNNVIMFQPNGSADFGTGQGYIFAAAESEHLYGHYSIDILASTGRVHTQSHYY